MLECFANLNRPAACSLDNDLASKEAKPGCWSLAGGAFGDEVSAPISVLGVHAKPHLVTGDFPLEDQRNGVALPLRIDRRCILTESGMRHCGLTIANLPSYAVTSHSSQGATADRVLVHVDTDQAHDQLVNSRLAYVSVSRGRYDAQIYTNDAEKLGEELSRQVSKQSAMETGHEMGGQDQGHATENAEHQSVSESHEHGQGYGMEH